MLKDIVRIIGRQFFNLFPYNTQIARFFFNIISRGALINTNIRHFAPTIMYSQEDVKINSNLVALSIDAIKIAADNELKCGNYDLPDSKFLNVFPGEHYRLINALVKVTKSCNVVEIGTGSGLGTLSLQDGIDEIKVISYDVRKWDAMRHPSHFTSDHLDNNRIVLKTADLSNNTVFEENFNILDSADLIFLDARKDLFYHNLGKQFLKLNKKENKFLIIDDIKHVGMIDYWRSISSPKIDLSSFGHWSGTGIVDISDIIEINI